MERTIYNVIYAERILKCIVIHQDQVLDILFIFICK